MDFPRIFAIFGFIIVGLISRLIPHPPNFTSINAIALLSVFFFGSRWLSFAMVIFILFISDCIIGFYPIIPFVYLGFSLIILLGFRMAKSELQYLPLYSLLSSSIFFILSNFGEWYLGSLYPYTFNGLVVCYVAAIPFFFNQVLGDLFFVGFLTFFMYLISNYISKKELVKIP